MYFTLGGPREVDLSRAKRGRHTWNAQSGICHDRRWLSELVQLLCISTTFCPTRQRYCSTLADGLVECEPPVAALVLTMPQLPRAVMRQDGLALRGDQRNQSRIPSSGTCWASAVMAVSSLTSMKQALLGRRYSQCKNIRIQINAVTVPIGQIHRPA
jgi:hypothetical protein